MGRKRSVPESDRSPDAPIKKRQASRSGLAVPRKTKTVLIIEDVRKKRDELTRAFADAEQFHYKILAVSGLEEFCDRRLDKNTRGFDVAVVDLALSSTETIPSRYSGFVYLRARRDEGILSALLGAQWAIIYTGRPEPATLGEAALAAADLFVPRDKYKPSALVEIVNHILNEKEAEKRQLGRKPAPGWEKTYAGQLIAVVRDEVVCKAPDRLRLLLAYHKKQKARKDLHSKPDCIFDFTDP